MDLKSSFKRDLRKEQQLSVLLDSIYQKYLKHYDYERVNALKRQLQGIDLVLTHRTTQNEFLIDEKAQLDYLNDDLPTFAFELHYQKNKEAKQGWLFDKAKKTDFYALITAIYVDEPDVYTSCKVTFVNRAKLILFLETRNITPKRLEKHLNAAQEHHGKIEMAGLDVKKEGYLYCSTQNKAEKPINLILKLDFLIEKGIAKRLV